MQYTKPVILLIGLCVLSCNISQAQKNWYVGEDTTHQTYEVHSLDEVMNKSEPGDTIYIFAGFYQLKGEIQLKENQSLIGISSGNKKPVISNLVHSSSGFGIILANNNLIKNISIDSTYKGGIYGLNSTKIRLENVNISNSNLSESIAESQVQGEPTALSNGSITIVNNVSDNYHYEFSKLHLSNAVGSSLSFTVLNGSKTSVVLDSIIIEGGKAIKIGRGYDIGMAFLVDSLESEINCAITKSSISGRRSRAGRNILVSASRKGVANISINDSYVGVSGQDGILGIGSFLPSKVNIEIANSTIERAAQINIEGTLLNLPVYDSTQLDQTEMKISIQNSIVRDPGKEIKFSTPGRNFWLGGTRYIQQFDPESKIPVSNGNYVLTIMDTKVLNSQRPAVIIGSAPESRDKSRYKIRLENSKFLKNQSLFLAILDASDLSVKATNVCWDYNQDFTGGPFLIKEGIGVLNNDIRQKLQINRAKTCDD